jgi:hypothetical protein
LPSAQDHRAILTVGGGDWVKLLTVLTIVLPTRKGRASSLSGVSTTILRSTYGVGHAVVTSVGESKPVEGIRLWRANRQKLIGMVYLEKGVLDLDIQDDHERALVEEVLEQTGQVTWSFSRFDEGEWQENIAEPRTERWLWFVVANILYPMGYQADLGISEDGEPTTG